MNSYLHRLARQGEIDWLSYYFAEFICSFDDSDIDSTLGQSAVMVSEASLAGNVCVDLSEFSNQPLFPAATLEGIAERQGPETGYWRSQLQTSKCVGGPGEHCPLILDDTRLYMNRFWYYEDFVATRIRTMLKRPATGDDTAIENGVAALFANTADMDIDQKQAVRYAADKPFIVVSGGPGSGKTSTVIRILALLLSQNPDYRIALAAPTGKAAARMMDSIQQRIDQLEIDQQVKAALPLEAKTLHRLLGYRHGGFSYNQEHRLPLDCVIVDEASMIDLKLMYQLLSALPEQARLILLGDRDQLASVAAGNVLADITGHGQQRDTTDPDLAQSIRLLRSNYRFGSDSAIGALARQVNLGDANGALALLETSGQGLHWYNADGERLQDDALAWLLDCYQRIFDSDTPAQALEVYESTRLLCATNRGPFGIDALNSRVSEALLVRNRLPVSELFSGLPIMITRNFRELGLYNGDTGMLWSFDGELRACFRQVDGSLRDLSINRLPEFKPAWAITVHKSQGSEFDSVLMLLPADAQAEVLSRELLYTAITRARQRFLLHGSSKVVVRAIDSLTRRHSGLAAKLGWR